jgi:hypothetical protein
VGCCDRVLTTVLVDCVGVLEARNLSNQLLNEELLDRSLGARGPRDGCCRHCATGTGWQDLLCDQVIWVRDGDSFGKLK